MSPTGRAASTAIVTATGPGPAPRVSPCPTTGGAIANSRIVAAARAAAVIRMGRRFGFMAGYGNRPRASRQAALHASYPPRRTELHASNDNALKKGRPALF